MLIDFDGTLAPIVEDIEKAVPAPGTPQLLGCLAGRYAVVAVISGRPLAYLERHLPLAQIGRTQLIGLYGLERAGSAHTREAERWRATIAATADAADGEAPPGLVVERKGLALTLHYRRAPEHAHWAERFAADHASRTGLAAHLGKMSVELRPPIPIDKGTVVTELAAGLDAVCFVGDDVGDLPAFAALKALPTTTTTLAVAVEGTEAPEELKPLADLTVDGPSGVIELLEVLAGGRAR